jgi:hypothetical protein
VLCHAFFLCNISYVLSGIYSQFGNYAITIVGSVVMFVLSTPT